MSRVHSSKKITVENKTFNSISDAARYYKLTPETVAKALKNGATINQAFKLELKPTDILLNLREIL